MYRKANLINHTSQMHLANGLAQQKNHCGSAYPLGFRGSKQSWSGVTGVHNILSLDGLLLRRNCFQPSEQKPCSRT
jgi:hypothetical protein